MCLFPIPNDYIDGVAYKKGVHFFDCGSCPECLKKRANVWALRSVYEAKCHVHNCMITLTYDNFIRNEKGEIIGETPVNPDLKVNQRHIQLFIKRLRKWCGDNKIKYLAAAEYGSRTHRAHYHCLLFGVHFPDMHFYKKSDRGNSIYMSKSLSRLWSYGICTIDSVNVQSAVARYCTKYCAKSRSDETFMLFSHRVGYSALKKYFNGISYFIDGIEYPVPRFIWEDYICRKHAGSPIYFTPKYKNRSDVSEELFENNVAMRKAYRAIRDSDPLYIKYLDYWQKKGQLFEKLKKNERERILALDDSKYHTYKVRALCIYDKKKSSGLFYRAPGSNRGLARECRDLERHYGFCFSRGDLRDLPSSSRLKTASDTYRYLFYKKEVIRFDYFHMLIKKFGSEVDKLKELYYNTFVRIDNSLDKVSLPFNNYIHLEV